MLADVCDSHAPRAVRRIYHRQMIVAALLYVGAVFVAVYVARHMSPPQWVLVLLSCAALAPVWMMISAYRRFVAGLDEFQRRIQSDSLAAATGIVGFACLTYGFLESFAGFPPIEGVLIWILPATAIVQGVVQVFLRRSYQ